MSKKGKVETGKKKVAIVGFATHKTEAPYKDETFEIWGLNDLYEHIPRWTRWFEMHDWNHICNVYAPRKAQMQQGSKPYLQGLSELTCPVYMQEVHPEIPTSVRYPVETIIEEFGAYFTNSISYMLALAIHEKFEVIHVYGVDMATDTEYGHQRPSCEYFMGVARGRGIETYLPKTSDLLKAHFQYGYEFKAQSDWDARVADVEKGIRERMRGAEEQVRGGEQARLQYMGALDAIRTLKRVHATNPYMTT